MYSIVLAAFLTTGNEAPAFGRRHGCRGGGVSYSAGCFGCWGGYFSGCYGSGGCYGGVSAGGCSGGGGASAGGGGASAGGGGAGGASAGSSGSGLAGGGGSSSTEVTENIKELKKSIAELKEEQTKFRLEGLKRTIAELRSKELEQTINELRRSIEELKHRVAPAAVPLPMPLPGPRTPPELPAPRSGKVLLEVPANALLFINDKPVAVTSTFTTPPLEPGKTAVYDFEVCVVRDGQSITRTKRLALRAGEVVRLAYATMSSDAVWTKGKPVASPAHITVRLAADARLTVDGLDCPLNSDIRAFDTPALAPGQEYFYVLTVKARRGGRTVEQTRRVVFRSGERVTVSFDNLDGSDLTAR